MTDLEVTPCTGSHTGHNISSGAQQFLGVQITSGNPLIGDTLESFQVALGKESASATGVVSATHQTGSTVTSADNTVSYNDVPVWSLPNTLFSFNFSSGITIAENDYFWITSNNTTSGSRMGVDYYDTCPNYTGFDSKKKNDAGTISALSGQLRSVWSESTGPTPSADGVLLPPPYSEVRF